MIIISPLLPSTFTNTKAPSLDSKLVFYVKELFINESHYEMRLILHLFYILK